MSICNLSPSMRPENDSNHIKIQTYLFDIENVFIFRAKM